MKKYWWLSFRDPDKNLNLGVCIVEATDISGAVDEAWRRKINPGGEVMGTPIDSLAQDALEPNRLYSREELVALGYGPGVGH